MALDPAISRPALALDNAASSSDSSNGIGPSTSDPVIPPHSSYMDSVPITNDSISPSLTSLVADPGLSDHGDATDLTPPTSPPTPEVDRQILEALKSKDRLFVLKVGEQLEALIKERRPRVDPNPATTYQRLLVHRVSAYYKLQSENDPITKGIWVLLTPEGRIPARRVCELVPAESPTQPAFKIMRRADPNRRYKPTSQADSIAGDDADLSDIESFETGSLGGRSSITNSSNKKAMTIEEREAAYNEARTRIFMGFEEKEKGKDKDLSASSSSLSLNSGSASTSTGARSSLCDTDDGSSPATESEWSGPSVPNKKDGRRGGSNSASSRSIRSGASFQGNSGSSRNSRAPSPSFAYPSLHEPPHLYDPSHPNMPPNFAAYPPNQFVYPYSPPGQPTGPGFLAPYPYYQHPYSPYQSPPPHAPNHAEIAANNEPFSPPPNFGGPYMWSHPPMQSPPHTMHHHPPPPPHQPSPMGPVPPQYQQQFMQPPHAYNNYPINAYYQVPPPSQPMAPPPPHMNMQPRHPIGDPRLMNGNPMGPPPPHPEQFHPNNRNGLTNSNGPVHQANNIRSPTSPPRNDAINGKIRGPPPPSGRGYWNTASGVGMGSHPPSFNTPNSEVVGPRFNNTRRTSNNSNSSNSRSPSNCDDVSSQASSSTTSSSSRRTYTSTTSSQQHPLPARPDWAVGIKAQSSLGVRPPVEFPLSGPRNGAPSRLADGSISPHANNTSSRQPPAPLQSTDFPPLTTVNSPERRAPAVTGAWGNARPVLSPTNGNVNIGINVNGAIGHHSGNAKQEDVKNGETFTPKFVRRPVGNVSPQQQRGGLGEQRAVGVGNGIGKEPVNTNKTDATTASLAGQVALMSLKENASESLMVDGAIEAETIVA